MYPIPTPFASIEFKKVRLPSEKHYNTPMSSLAEQLIAATRSLTKRLTTLHFSPPVAHTYNPLTYAGDNYELYLRRYADSPKQNFFLGMNPGPFGMAQTGIPFGEVNAVKHWLNLQAPIRPPADQHPKRPILGLNCTRSEVSGLRLWGLFQECFSTPEAFFQDNFVANFCPLVWMNESGANITPDKIKAQEISPVEDACLDYLETQIRLLNPTRLIGVGAYAGKKLELVARRFPNRTFTLGTLLHPSPASPIANKLWPQRPIEQLQTLGILSP